MKGMRAGLLSALAACAFLGGDPVARAGDRELDAVFVRVDDGSDPASRACFRAIRAPLARESSSLRSMSRAALLRAIAADSMDGFEAWPRKRFAGAVDGVLDALVLVDCRPGEQIASVVVFAGTSDDLVGEGTLFRAQIHGIAIDASVQHALGSRVQGWAWTDFSP